MGVPMFAISMWLYGSLGFIIGFARADSDASASYIPSYLSSAVSKNQSEVYFLSSRSNSSNDLVFQSLNITASFKASHAPLTVISHDLPFAKKGDSPSFVYTTTANGTLTVYTGDCRNSSADLWTYVPPKSSQDSTDEGTWNHFPVNRSNDSAVLIKGPPAHSSMMSYPPGDNSSSPLDYYVFGGMCSTEQSRSVVWSQPPVYSANLTQLSLDDKKDKFEAKNVRQGAVPFPGAGFTMTGLLPLYSEPQNLTRRDTVYGQDFALIGGHTSQSWSAEPLFMNMSTIGLLSLPEKTWTFLDAQTDKDGLHDFNVSVIQPRTGHSAVRSPDGTKIVLVGGWLMNTTIAAQPQIAILDVGQDYGGSGPWTWRASKNMSGMFKDGVGIYGHAATVLPGGSMIIAGGYSIKGHNKTGNEQHSKRSEASSQVLVFDFDSESWVSSYTAPNIPTNPDAPQKEVGKKAGPLSSPGQKAGLAIGLIIAALLIALGLICCLRRRRRRRDAVRTAVANDEITPEMEQSRSFEPPSAFSDYRERVHLTPSPTESTTGWPADHSIYSQSSSFQSGEISNGYDRPVAVAGLGPADTGTPRGLGLPSSLVLGTTESMESQYAVHSSSRNDDSSEDPQLAQIGNQRVSDTSQVAEPLLSETNEEDAEPFIQVAKGKERAQRDVTGYHLVPAGDPNSSDSKKPRRMAKEDRRVTDSSNESSILISADHTMSDWSETSHHTHSTARTRPLFSRAIGNVFSAFGSASDPSFSRQPSSRYEPFRAAKVNQPHASRSYPEITSQPYVSLVRDKKGTEGSNITVKPAPQFAVLANRGRSDSQPKPIPQSDNISGVMGNVAQIAGPIRRALLVGEPQSVEPETTSIPERSSTGQSSNGAKGTVKRHSANDVMGAKMGSKITRSHTQPHLNPSDQQGERTSDVPSETSFNSLNMPDDWKIETAFQGRVIDTPSRLRLVDSRPGSKKDSRSVRTQNSQFLDVGRRNDLSRANSRNET